MKVLCSIFLEEVLIIGVFFDLNNMFNARTVFEGEFQLLCAHFRGQNVRLIVPF